MLAACCVFGFLRVLCLCFHCLLAFLVSGLFAFIRFNKFLGLSSCPLFCFLALFAFCAFLVFLVCSLSCYGFLCCLGLHGVHYFLIFLCALVFLALIWLRSFCYLWFLGFLWLPWFLKCCWLLFVFINFLAPQSPPTQEPRAWVGKWPLEGASGELQ